MSGVEHPVSDNPGPSTEVSENIYLSIGQFTSSVENIESSITIVDVIL
jgi:hypothetical protein